MLSILSVTGQTINEQISSLVSDKNTKGEIRNIGKTIPYGRHFLDEGDVNSVVKALTSGSLTQGPNITQFEQNIARYTGAKYAVAVSSATAGLH